MTEAEELEKIEKEIADLGTEITARAKRALEIVGGRIATIRGNKFRIDHARPVMGGMGYCHLYYSGPRLKQDGTLAARNSESAPMRLIDKIERPFNFWHPP